MCGEGVGKDDEKGVHWFERACQGGSSLGRRCLAVCAVRGLGMAKNEEMAVTLYVCSEQVNPVPRELDALAELHVLARDSLQVFRECAVWSSVRPVVSRCAPDH